MRLVSVIPDRFTFLLFCVQRDIQQYFSNILRLFHLCLPPLGSGDKLFYPVRLSAHHKCFHSCERNSSYNFNRIVLKLCGCFVQGLLMCMRLSYNIMFRYFRRSLNLVVFDELIPKYIDTGYLVHTTPPLIVKLCRRFVTLVCLFCCCTSQVNSYAHGGLVSSPNHTFSWASLNKRLTSTSCIYFRL